MTLHRNIVRSLALAAIGLSTLAGEALAQHAGFRTLAVASDPPMTVALFYPTTVAARVIPMGPWQPLVSPGAPPSDAPLKGLILISHGTSGTELNHHNLGTRLARDGYLVAAVRHPGDNWQDRSLILSGRYFSERPRQLSRVLDALMASPEWGARIPVERIGAVGHSAGGYGVLALAGGQAEPGRAAKHCAAVQDDPGFCSLAKGLAESQGTAVPPAYPAKAAEPSEDRVSVADPRIRAVVALAPMAVVLTTESLSAIKVPVRILVAERDAVLNGKYHGAYAVANMPRAQANTVTGAGHFAFMSQSTIPLPSVAGDAASNPAGFDRVAYLPELENQVSGFFGEQWR